MSRFPDTVYSRTVNSLTCDVDGCDDRAAVVVTSTIDDLWHFVCYRCADELTAAGEVLEVEMSTRTALAKAYSDGYNAATTMARCYGHTDNRPAEEEPRNPYDEPADEATGTPSETLRAAAEQLWDNPEVMPPGVAFSLADWLDAEVDRWDARGRLSRYALDVARAVLRET